MNTNINLRSSALIEDSPTTMSVATISQVTDEGVQEVLQGFAEAHSIKITNLFLLANFVIPTGKSDLKGITFDDIKDYIVPQGIIGNNGIRLADGSMDMRCYISSSSPFEFTSISSIPADKMTIEPTVNACVLVQQGDSEQSVSQGSNSYMPTGTEKIFAIATFPETTKIQDQPFTVMWFIRLLT